MPTKSKENIQTTTKKAPSYTYSSIPSIIPGYLSQPFECVSIYFVA